MAICSSEVRLLPLTVCRLVDILLFMKSNHSSPTTAPVKARQIVGFSLPPELAAAVKVEAARRNISLRNLFAEMWDIYKKNKSV